MENPTSEYNCHGFAFHLSEGNTNKVWINNTGSNLSTYWTDGSFIEVCNESDADKAYYYAGDHSAKTTSSVSGLYESKWGYGHRLIHAPTDCPYDVGLYRRQYYASTKISGDASTLCSGTRLFSVKNISGAAYTWTYSSTLSVVSATNTNQLTVQRNGSSSGAAWVQVQISTPCSSTSVTSRIDFSVGIQTLSVSSYVDRTPQASNYQYVNATATQLSGTVPGDYSWYEEVNGIRGSQIAIGLQLLNYPIPPCTTVYYQCVATTACGELVYRGYAYNTSCGGYAVSGSLAVYPNPASTELNISNTEEASDAPKNESISNTGNPEFQVKLYDAKGNILRSAKNPKGSKGLKLDITEVPNGTYYLHISKGKEVSRKQIIIQH